MTPTIDADRPRTPCRSLQRAETDAARRQRLGESIVTATRLQQSGATIMARQGMRRLLMFVGFVFCAPGLALAKVSDELVLPGVEFSAVAVHEAGAVKEQATIHYADGKLRIDRGHGFSSTILDLKTETQYLLMVNHTYLVLPMDEELFRRYIARKPSLSSTQKIGQQRIEGLETTKYAFDEDGALDAGGFYWLTQNGVMVRREYTDGVFGVESHHREFLSHISFEKQPVVLFQIPSGYRPAK
jgi:hypothetical protein